MSINIGNFNKYEYINNNNFIVNSYNDSNVIILNADDTSYNDNKKVQTVVVTLFLSQLKL